VCRRENVGSNIKFLVELGKSVSKIREMLVQVYGDDERTQNSSSVKLPTQGMTYAGT
jgi:hypothetical protein